MLLLNITLLRFARFAHQCRVLLRRNRPQQLPPATISEYRGMRYLHLGSLWEQGAMRIDRPDAIATTYLQQMMIWWLFKPQARHVVQLGLGAAALTKFCYRRLPDARVSAVEINPAVIGICRERFALPPDDGRLAVIEMDAMAFVADTARHGTIDVLQVDLYDGHAHGPVCNDAAFYRACAACLMPDGMMTVNLFGIGLDYEKSLQSLQACFASVMWLPKVHGGNLVVLACKRAQALHLPSLSARARVIRRQTGLPTKTWVGGLTVWSRLGR
jgi:spermidine synthase